MNMMLKLQIVLIITFLIVNCYGFELLSDTCLSPEEVGSNFGQSGAVSATGNCMVIGADSYRVGDRPVGGVYVYKKKNDTTRLTRDSMWNFTPATDDPVIEPPEEADDFRGAGGVKVNDDCTVLTISGNRGGDRAVFIYEKADASADAAFNLQQVITGPSSDGFAFRMDMDSTGKTLAISANLANEKGEVYIYEKNLETGFWEINLEFGTLQHPFVDKVNYFGESVAVCTDSNIIAIGTKDANNKLNAAGSVVVFKRQGDEWEAAQVIYGISENAFFGNHIKLSKDCKKMLVGAYRENSMGAVHVLEETNEGIYEKKFKLVPIDGVKNDGFGTSFDGDGEFNILYISSPSANKFTGKAYVFEKSTDGSYFLRQVITNDDAKEDDGFGWIVMTEETGSGVAFTAYGKYEGLGAVCIYQQVRTMFDCQNMFQSYEKSERAGKMAACVLNTFAEGLGEPGGRNAREKLARSFMTASTTSGASTSLLVTGLVICVVINIIAAVTIFHYLQKRRDRSNFEMIANLESNHLSSRDSSTMNIALTAINIEE